MSDERYKIIPESLFDLSGVYCGVVMPERVMRKIVKLQAACIQEIKRTLTEHKDELYASNWTLYYPNGEQKEVRYIDPSDSINIESRIKHAAFINQPRHLPLVFIASSQDEAKSMADAHHEETFITTN
ncbi:TPA: hypothetical protein ACLMQK_004544 [Yersinia enterocolitica]|uniref:hypothetical protein n=1 Tax=Yersinia enterocolitica TaxID=630 RepID=UPI00387D1FC4